MGKEFIFYHDGKEYNLPVDVIEQLDSDSGFLSYTGNNPPDMRAVYAYQAHKAAKETNNQKPKALRFNEGKPMLSLIPVKALIEEVKVWEKGMEKYGRNNWQKFYGDDTVLTVMDSLLRHCMAILEGETYDKETGLYHAAHIRCNAAIIIHYLESIKQA
jgi:hypothetical protein